MNPLTLQSPGLPTGFRVVAPGRPARPVDQYDAPSLLGPRSQQRFHVMVKPGGSSCNLNCAYCFYLGKQALPGVLNVGRMSDEVLERFIQQYIASVTGPEVVFSWQGGEPTLLGLEFFRKVVAFEAKHRKPFQRIENDLQTNGTLIDEEWCAFLKANRFLVGLSIDGPREIHDCYRLTKGGEPTFLKVFNAAKLLQHYAVPFNTLTCVHRLNARKPLDIYRFLRNELGSNYIQFIPIVEYKGFERTAPHQWDNTTLPQAGEPGARPGHSDSLVTDWSVDADDWGYFLCKTFDEWRNKDVGKVFVNHFETLVSQHLGLGPQVCVYGEFCGKGVAVEHDGSVYACDHYVYPEYRLGQLNDAQLGPLVFSRAQVQFGYAKNETLPQQCRQCPFLQDCWGECPKNRFLRTAAGEAGLNYLCPGLKSFFAHAIPEVERIAARLRRQPMQPQKRT